jgi:hypothetical protein
MGFVELVPRGGGGFRNAIPFKARLSLLLQVIGQQFFNDSGEVVRRAAHAINEIGIQCEVYWPLEGGAVVGWFHMRMLCASLGAGKRQLIADSRSGLS